MKRNIILLILCILVFSSFVSADFIDDMKVGTDAYFEHEDNTDNTNIYNYTTVSGATVTTTNAGIINECYFFDGSNDYIKQSSLTTGGTFFSLNAWVKTSNTIDNQAIASHSNTNSNYWGFHIRGNKLAFYLRGTYGTVSSVSGAGDNIATSNWEMVSVVKNGTNLKLYKNAIEQNDGTISNMVRSGDFFVGSLSTSTSWIMDGYIDELSIFNYSLNTTSLEYLYNLGSPGILQQYPYTIINVTNFTITLDYPINNTNYHLVGINESKVFNGSIILSTNIAANCSLNNSLFSLDNNETNIFNFINNSDIPDNIYPIFANCTSGNNKTNISFIFTIDTTDPSIDLINPISNNTIQKNNFSLNVSYSDLYLYRTNTTITRLNDNQITFNNYSGDLPGGTVWYNISKNISLINGSYTIGQYKLFLEATDTHTKKDFLENPKLKKEKINNKYKTDIGLKKGKFSITHDLDMDISTIKEKDRIKFNHKKTTLERSEIIIEGDKLIYLKDSEYPCHFIVNDNYWYDCVGFTNPNIIKLNNKQYKILWDQDKTEVITDSLGGLNNVNKTYFFRVVNETTGLITKGDIFSPPNVTFNYTAVENFTVTSLILNETCIVITGANVSSYNGTYCYDLNSLYLDDVIAFVNMTPIDCFGNLSNLMGSTIPTITKWYNKTDNIIKTSTVATCEHNQICTLDTLNASLISFNNSFSCVANVTTSWFTFQSNESNSIDSDSLGVCSAPNIYQVTNISYYDEISLATIDPTNAYSILFSDGLGTINLQGNFSNATSHSFCTSVNPAVDVVNLDFWGNFTLRKALYSTRVLNFIESNAFLVSNLPVNNISMFLIKLNESSTIEYTWRTTSFQFIDGIMIIKRCNDDGSKTLISSIPIANGFASANLQLFTVPYSYEVIINNETFTDATFSVCHVENVQQRDYFVDVDLINILPTIGLFLVDCRMTKTSNTTAKMTWTANTQDNSNIEGCMIGKQWTVFGEQEVFRNCTTASVGDFTRTVSNPGSPLTVVGEITQDGNIGYCADTLYFYTDDPRPGIIGLSGLFAAMIIVLVMTYVLITESGTSAVIGTGIGYVVSFILGVLVIEWQTVLLVIFLCVMIALIGRYTKKSQIG